MSKDEKRPSSASSDDAPKCENCGSTMVVSPLHHTGLTMSTPALDASIAGQPGSGMAPYVGWVCPDCGPQPEANEDRKRR